MVRNNSRIRGTKKNRTRKKKGGNSYEKGKPCMICSENAALDRFCANGHYFCSVCIESWKGRGGKCPACRGRYEPEEPIDIDNTGYGQYRYSKGFVDAPVSIGLVKNYGYGDCCTPCKKSICGKIFCGRPTCRAYKKNSAKKIIGIYDDEGLYCKKEGYGYKNNGGGKKKRRKRRRTKKRSRRTKKRSRRRKRRR